MILASVLSMVVGAASAAPMPLMAPFQACAARRGALVTACGDAPAVGSLREEPAAKKKAPWVKAPPPTPAGVPPPGLVEAAELDLEDSLDAMRAAAPLKLGKEEWLLGFASDAEFRKYYLAFTRAGETRLVPIDRPKDLLGEGLLVPLAERESYRARLRIDLTAPVRDSRLEIAPERGGSSPLSVKTGDALDRLEAAATKLEVPGRKLFVAYMTDLDPATGEPAGTRSLFFFEEHRFLPKAWRVPEASLARGRPLEVLLGKVRLVLVRSEDEKVSFFHLNPKGPSGTGR